MSKITLTTRDLATGERGYRELEDESEAIAFLKARPRNCDVLGVTFDGLTPEINARLRGAMRPLDDEERALEARLAEADLAAREADRAARQARDAQLDAQRSAPTEADPDRKMEIRYVYGAELMVADPTDGRPITPEARDAVLAWVAERTEWVASRGQIVADAKVTVWPGKLPKPGADRVAFGTFVPITAPAP